MTDKLPWRWVWDRKADSDDWGRVHGCNIGNAYVVNSSIADAIFEDIKDEHKYASPKQNIKSRNWFRFDVKITKEIKWMP